MQFTNLANILIYNPPMQNKINQDKELTSDLNSYFKHIIQLFQDH